MSLNRLLSYLTTPIGLLGSFSYLALLFLYIRATRRIPKTGFGIKPVKGFGSHPEPDGLEYARFSLQALMRTDQK